MDALGLGLVLLTENQPQAGSHAPCRTLPFMSKRGFFMLGVVRFDLTGCALVAARSLDARL
jgi:hypothetical protein